MWDSLFAQANFSESRMLPSSILWSLDEIKSNRNELSIVFVEHGKHRRIRLDVEPSYFSMADEWIEAYGGMEATKSVQFLKSGLNLQELKENIHDVSPGYSECFENLELYLISAMEWTIRIASLEPPKITEIEHAH
ncbi:MAG: hypothetical protein ACSHX3_06905 [Litorimonas sp.]